MNAELTGPQWGLLLVNLGTPDSPGTSDVRRYLREFLSDPRVLDINPALRSFLLNVVILPTRPARSGAAYRRVWTDRGSPLLFHTLDLAQKVRKRLRGVQVEVAMRYQSPSIGAALEKFRSAGIDRIVVLPLFPQYSSAAFGSAVEKVWAEAAKRWNTPSLHIVEAFYEHPAFIESFRQVSKPILDDLKPDRVLFSYHGVPERHVRKSDETPRQTHCLASGSCCDAITLANRNCYRAQCFATTRALAAALGLTPDQYEVSFQSRLGRDPWIKPYTDVRIEQMAKEGVRRLAVFSPAFVADCLETIEEIGMEGAHEFKEAGGEELRLIPSLNSEDVWADAVTTIALENAPTAWTGAVAR